MDISVLAINTKTFVKLAPLVIRKLCKTTVKKGKIPKDTLGQVHLHNFSHLNFCLFVFEMVFIEDGGKGDHLSLKKEGKICTLCVNNSNPIYFSWIPWKFYHFLYHGKIPSSTSRCIFFFIKPLTYITLMPQVDTGDWMSRIDPRWDPQFTVTSYLLHIAIGNG